MQLPALSDEIRYRAVRGSGPGGQHVNKTSTKVELRWSLNATTIFSSQQKELLRERLSSRLTTEGDIVLTDHTSRSQSRNRQLVTQRFYALIEESLKPMVKRKKSKPTQAVKRRRREEKSRRSEIKASRRKLW